MDLNSVKRKQVQWALFQLAFPIVVVGLEIFLKFELDTQYEWLAFFKTQKLTLMSFVVFLNMSFVVLLESNSFTLKGLKDAFHSSIVQMMLYLFISFVAAFSYIILLIKGIDLNVNDEIFYAGSSIVAFLLWIVLAVILQLNYTKRVIDHLKNS